MDSKNIVKINGHHYIKIENEDLKIIQTGEAEIKLVYKSESKTKLDIYWDRAARDFKREIFMNTVRPLLKETLGLNYTEIKCEEKAKLLCQKYYEFEEKGEVYSGPYLL